MQWFCPLPWKTVECEIDLRPGGIFRTVMRGPAGEENEHVGCYLEVETNRKLTWTTALVQGFRPTGAEGGLPFVFTAIITMEPRGKGTRYVATAIHKDPDIRAQHEQMGFHEGWGTALDQLAAFAKRINA